MRALLRRTADVVGRGLVAGLVGTVAMTVSSTLEAKLRQRGDSDTPSQAVAEVLGVEEYRSDTAKDRVNQLAHWSYGTGLGAVRGILELTGLGRNATDVLFHATVLGAEQTMLNGLGLVPPITQWGRQEVATDLTHHTVYSLTTNGVFRWLAA